MSRKMLCNINKDYIHESWRPRDKCNFLVFYRVGTFKVDYHWDLGTFVSDPWDG